MRMFQQPDKEILDVTQMIGEELKTVCQRLTTALSRAKGMDYSDSMDNHFSIRSTSV